MENKFIVEKIYKCRSCQQAFRVVDGFDLVLKGSDVPLIIHSRECKNCCLPTTNVAVITVIADLVKYNIIDEDNL
jgi:hypothetical protein